MPIDFPNSPSNGSTHTVNGVTWEYDGTAWNVASGGAGLRVSATAPTSPATGDLWYDSESGKVFIYYDSQWVSPAVVASVPTASASTITGTNSEGTSTSFARADHNHQVRATGFFRAQLSADTPTISVGVVYPVVFNNEITDLDGWYNPANGRFTPQRAGWYWMGGQMVLTNIAGGYWHIFVLKNGNIEQELALLPTSAAGYPRVTTQAPLYANGSTDYFQLAAYTSIYTGKVNGGSLFWAAYIGSG